MKYPNDNPTRSTMIGNKIYSPVTRLWTIGRRRRAKRAESQKGYLLQEGEGTDHHPPVGEVTMKPKTIITTMLDSPTATSSPTTTTLSSPTTRSTKQEEDAKVEAIIALRDVIIKQRDLLMESKAKERSLRQHIRRLAALLQVKDMQEIRNNSPSKIRAKALEQTADSSSPGATSTLSSHVTQVETAILKNQVESLQQEASDLKSELNKSRELNQNLQKDLQSLEEQVSLAQLEAELARAEAFQAKTDLSTCLIHMQSAETTSLPTPQKNILQRMAASPHAYKTPRKSNRRNQQSEAPSMEPRIMCLACRAKEEEPPTAPVQSPRTQVSILESEVAYLRKQQKKKERMLLAQMCTLEQEHEKLDQVLRQQLRFKDIQIARLRQECSKLQQQVVREDELISI
jgi:hypothetical protein